MKRFFFFILTLTWVTVVRSGVLIIISTSRLRNCNRTLGTECPRSKTHKIRIICSCISHSRVVEQERLHFPMGT